MLTIVVSGFFLSFFGALHKFFFRLRKVFKVVLDILDVNLIAFFDSAPALFLAHVVPCIFNIRNCAVIDGAHIGVQH
jgi:hypothetical protein